MQGSWSQISAFLSNAIPWPAGSFLNIHAFTIDAASKKLIPRASRAAQDLQEAVSFCQWCDGQGWEVYACMAAQRQPGTGKADKRGRTHHRALRGEANSVCSRSFYVDVDVKEGAYKSSQEAVDALRAFCGVTGLPPPSIIVWSGGGGFHAHWLLDQPIDPPTWKPVAQQLAAACRQHGLLADTSVTPDISRILRVPGTLNRKYDAGRTVTMEIVGTQTTFAAFSQILSTYPANSPVPNFSGSAPPGRPSTTQDLDPKIFPIIFPPVDPLTLVKWLEGTEIDPPTLVEVAVGCPLVRQALATGGAGYHEPLWFETGKIAHFTDDGLAGFHLMSKGHASYDPAATEEKYQYIVSSQIANDRGWPRCTTIENAGSTECGNCHNKNFQRSPLSFARKIPPAPKVTPASNAPTGNPAPIIVSRLPIAPAALSTTNIPGYGHDPSSGIVMTNDKDGIEIPIWGYPIWNLEIAEDPVMNRGSIHFDTNPDANASGLRWRHVTLPMKAVSDSRVLRDVLAEQYRLGITYEQTPLVMKFMVAFMQELRNARKEISVQESIGWSIDDTGKAAGFAYGNTRFNCAGNTPFHQSDPILRKTYSPRGSFDAWKAAIAMLNDEKRPAMDLLAATAFAAPLMRFTGQQGVVALAFSAGSAHHKTTGLWVGQTVWGSPTGINQLTDTMNSIIEKLGQIKVLPSYYDEMKASSDVEKFANMVLTLSGGRSKGRLGRNAEVKEVSSWDTMLIGASNDSLISHLAAHDKSTEAGMNRVFEFEVDRPNPSQGQISMGDAGKIIAALKDNYGHAGNIYAEQLGKSVDTLPQMVTDMIDMYRDALKANQDERFWIAFMAAVTVGGQLANNLNLTRFDIARMADFMIQSTARLRTMRSAGEVNIATNAGIASALAYFINSNRRATVITDIMYKNLGPGGTMACRIINAQDLQHTDRLVAHIAQVDNIIRLSRRQFMDWCEKHKLPAVLLMNDIKTKLGGQIIHTRLGTGTQFNTGMKEYLIELDGTHPDIAPLMSY